MPRATLLLYAAGALAVVSLVWGGAVVLRGIERPDAHPAPAIHITGDNTVSVTGSGNQVVSGTRVVARDGPIEIEGQVVPIDARAFVTTAGHRYLISYGDFQKPRFQRSGSQRSCGCQPGFWKSPYPNGGLVITQAR